MIRLYTCIIVAFIVGNSSFGQIFVETMGTPAATTLVTNYETANGFDNDALTMSGSSDVRTSTPSSGYSGSSGGGNVFITNTIGRNFIISGINTSGCTNLVLSFGAHKSTTDSNMTELVLEYSVDGTTWVPLSIPAQPTGSGTASWRLITISLPVGAENQPNLQLRWTNSSSSIQFRLDDITLTGSCGPPSNTISAGTISGGPFSVNCNGTTDTGSITYTSTGDFNPGNTFTLQLSNSAGSFAAPITIGSDANTGTDPSGTINFTLPDNLPTGAGYQLQIVSSDPIITSSVSSTFTITQTGSCITVGPHITSVIINSCQTGSCAEGRNEIIFGNSGDFSVNVTTSNFEIYYGSSPSPTSNLTNSITTNATTTALLNTEAGCPGTFVEGTNSTMPPGASFMVVHNTLCTDALDWASLCGAGPIYVIYTTSTNWNTGGNFVNSASGMRYFETQITSTNAITHEVDYDWNSNNLEFHDDGDYVAFSPTGGSATTYGNNGCTIDPIVLGSDLLSMIATYSTPNGHITWVTSSETSNDYFELFHSSNGLDWNKIASIKGAGTTTETNSYEVFHRDLEIGNNYYKLFSVDFDGSTHFKGIRLLKVSSTNFAYFNTLSSEIVFNTPHSISIHSLDGKLIVKSKDSPSIPFNHKGVFILYDSDNQQTQRLVIF